MKPPTASELAEGRRLIRERAAAALDLQLKTFKYGRGVNNEKAEEDRRNDRGDSRSDRGSGGIRQRVSGERFTA